MHYWVKAVQKWPENGFFHEFIYLLHGVVQGRRGWWDCGIGVREEGVANIGWEINFSWAVRDNVSLEKPLPQHLDVVTRFLRSRPAGLTEHIVVVLSITRCVQCELERLQTVIV